MADPGAAFHLTSRAVILTEVIRKSEFSILTAHMRIYRIYIVMNLTLAFLQSVPKKQKLEGICSDVSFVWGGHYNSEVNELWISSYLKRTIHLMLVQIHSNFPLPVIAFLLGLQCVRRAPYIYPLQIQKIEKLGK